MLPGFWLALPEDVDDNPTAVDFGQLHIVDPVGHDRLGACGVAEDIQNPYVFLLAVLRGFLSISVPGAVYQH